MSGRLRALTENPRRPQIDRWSKPFWTGGARNELVITQCKDCERLIHPPLPRCPYCGGNEINFAVLSGRATITSFTVNRQHWHPWIGHEYIVAYVAPVEDERLHLLTNIVDCDIEDVAIGMPVRARFLKRDNYWIPIFSPENGQ